MNEHNNTIQVTLKNGVVSHIDENIYQLILGLERQVQSPKALPPFWNLAQVRDTYDPVFLAFYSYLLTNGHESRAQLFQDLFALFATDAKTAGTFLEFGATNGVDLSNSWLLENRFGWRGVLAEPSPQWQVALRDNRPEATILTECIYDKTGETLDFFVSDTGELSTLEAYRHADAAVMPGNTRTRNASGYAHRVQTLSLNDLFLRHFDGQPIDYMSVDTEGSEVTILQAFDFARFGPKVVTVEHNFTEAEESLDTLFETNGYQRLFREFTQFDAWYIRKA